MRLESPVLSDGGDLLVRFTKDDRAYSPPVQWADIPSGTAELVLVMENLTPSTQPPHVHWCVYGIPPDLGGLPEGMMSKTEPGDPPVRQGLGDAGKTGYDAPVGTINRRIDLRLRVIAVGRRLDFEPGADAHDVLQAAEMHKLDEAFMTLHYVRPK